MMRHDRRTVSSATIQHRRVALRHVFRLLYSYRPLLQTKIRRGKFDYAQAEKPNTIEPIAVEIGRGNVRFVLCTSVCITLFISYRRCRK